MPFTQMCPSRTVVRLGLSFVVVLAIAPYVLGRLVDVGLAAQHFPEVARVASAVAFLVAAGVTWLAAERRYKAIDRRVRERTRLIRQQNEALIELAKRGASDTADVQEALRRITETASRTMPVARASVWLIDAERTRIWCLDLYDAAGGRHTCGVELARASYPRYFEALEGQGTIAAADAFADPRTAEFGESYLRPLGIGAMLDVPVWVGGRAVGVVCHEHVGGPRAWTAEEEHFADCLANLVATALESADRHRAEEALRASEERNRLVARATNDVVWDWVFARHEIYWSEALLRVFGHDPARIDRSLDWWADHLHPGDRDRVLSSMHEAVNAGEETWAAEYRFRRADGTYATVLDRGWVGRDASGRPVRMIGSMLDLTERRRGEELERERAALARAVASMEQVLGVVGHELRTPLAGLRAMSEVLLTERAREAVEFDAFLRGIHDEVVRMSDTVHNLLEAARLNSGKARWNWSTFTVAEVCKEAVEGVRQLVDGGRVALTLSVEPADLAMRGDADAVRRLVTNLLSNAQKHTAAGSIEVLARAVTVCGSRGLAGVCLEVRDTGAGIPPAVRARLGEAFALNSGVVGGNYVRGAGLGMAICKGIVLAHGGTMDVESEVGRGTVVRATLRADLPGPVGERGDEPEPERTGEGVAA